MTTKQDLYLLANYADFTNYSDIIKTKFNFTCLVDVLNKDNQISDRTAQNVYLHIDTTHKKTYIICGSYKLKIE